MGTIPDLTDDEWVELTELLTLYAQRKISKLYWRGMPARRGTVALGGVGPQDLASEAIVAVIEGKRACDAQNYSDFKKLLEGVIDSKVNHLAESVENRITRPEAVSPEGKRIAPRTQSANRELDPANIYSDKDAADQCRSLIEKEIEGDTDLEMLFECMRAEIIKPQDIAEVLGLDVTEVNNIQKRLRRRVDKAIRRHMARSTK